MTNKKSLLVSMASRYEMEPKAFADTLKATVMPGKVSNEQFAGFLMVAKEYNLNPLTKEIYAFPSKKGIQPIVSIDGWMKMMNSHPQFDGLAFTDHIHDGALGAITAKVYRKDREHPVEVTEYMAECRRKSPTWDQWPARMLRHKAAIQAARYAFGFSGIYEPDEAERIQEAKDVTPRDSGIEAVKRKLAIDVEEEEEYIPGADEVETEEEEQAA